MFSSGDCVNLFEQGDVEMVKCIGKFSLLLKRLRDAWMDMLPMSAMSEERRRNQYLADVTKTVRKDKEEMWILWIRTHRKPETGGMPHR